MKYVRAGSIFALLMLFLVCSAGLAAQPWVVILVRHAEKIDSSRDPELSPRGKARAKALAAMLRDVHFDHIYSTDFIRTRDTAAPLAGQQKSTIELYDPRHLEALAEQVRRHGGRSLVVGHSNTTPDMVRLLGGDAGPPIDEGGEYDRFYVVTTAGDGTVHTILLRYGRTESPE